MEFLFVSLNEEWINEMRKLGYNNTYLGKIEDYQFQDTERIVYVSPANSLCFMDGGIDLAYTIMFPGIEAKVKKQLTDINLLGRHFLPIGKTVLTQVDSNKFVISSPTMLLPQNISETNNAYYATFAVLKMLRSVTLGRKCIVVIPSMCCGYGQMSVKNSAEQIHRAIIEEQDNELDLKRIMDEQPNYYCNSEWKNIYPK